KGGGQWVLAVDGGVVARLEPDVVETAFSRSVGRNSGQFRQCHANGLADSLVFSALECDRSEARIGRRHGVSLCHGRTGGAGGGEMAAARRFGRCPRWTGDSPGHDFDPWPYFS